MPPRAAGSQETLWHRYTLWLSQVMAAFPQLQCMFMLKVLPKASLVQPIVDEKVFPITVRILNRTFSFLEYPPLTLLSLGAGMLFMPFPSIATWFVQGVGEPRSFHVLCVTHCC